MRNIAVIGAGQAGLIFSHALLAEGYQVTLYSDRTAEQWLHDSRPTGTAFLYGEVIDIERDLGLDHWSETMHTGGGALIDFCQQVGTEPLTITGRLRRTGGAVDQRVKFHRWMNDFESDGGRLEIATVAPEMLDGIALDHDLVVLAAGKADLANLVPRDPVRSVYDRPQRNLTMAIVTGVRDDWAQRAGFTPIKFNMFADIGEFFWVPYTHKTAGTTWCPLFEAKFGGPLDRFGSCRTGSEVVDIMKELVSVYAPWDLDAIKDAQFVEDDPHGWLTGRFAPTVRAAFGRLPSGKPVMPIGDTAITFDPVGGQGGNCASRNAKFIADAVISRGELQFDEGWMTMVNHGFWEAHGRWAYAFNNMILEPMTDAGKMAFQAAAEDEWMGSSVLVENFAAARNFFPWIAEPRLTAQRLEELRQTRANQTPATNAHTQPAPPTASNR